MPKHSERSLEDAIDTEKKYRQHIEKETRRKELKAANKQYKKTQMPKKGRRKNWIPEDPEAWEDWEALEEKERRRARREGERRHAVERKLGKKGKPRREVEPFDDENNTPDLDMDEGMVVEVSQGLCRVEVGRETILCALRGSLEQQRTGFSNVLAVGDKVLISKDGRGGGVVEELLPRRSMLARTDTGNAHRRQVIVANADQLLVVSAWQEPNLWLELLDRYLIAAERNSLPPIICINKVDLAENEADIHKTMQPYRALTYPVILTSAETGRGIEELQLMLANRLTVLAGLSGVGKSSLVQAIQPGLELRTGDVDEYGGGRHTTTQANLFKLNNKGAVIDTPGIREFGLSGLEPSELAHYFPEMLAVLPQCRFSDCAHINEPACAVKAGVEEGTIAESRYQSYLTLYEELGGTA